MYLFEIFRMRGNLVLEVHFFANGGNLAISCPGLCCFTSKNKNWSEISVFVRLLVYSRIIFHHYHLQYVDQSDEPLTLCKESTHLRFGLWAGNKVPRVKTVDFGCGCCGQCFALSESQVFVR